MVHIEGELPVAIKLTVGQEHLSLKKVIMTQMTAVEFLEAQVKILPGQYIAIGDLASMTKLIDEKGNAHQMTYEMLATSSKSNLKKLEELKDSLEAKEQAES